MYGYLRTIKTAPGGAPIKILADSGASSSVINYKCVKHLHKKKGKPISWQTAAGIMKTEEKTTIQFRLPEFDNDKIIEWDVHVTKETTNYDMILGRDLLSELNIILDFSTQQINWEGAAIPMKGMEESREQSFHVQDSASMTEATDCIKRILDAKYEPADIDAVVEENQHLNPEERSQLKTLLQKYKTLFDGSLGNGKKKSIRLNLNKELLHTMPEPIQSPNHMKLP